jgi:hypothetical protein
MIWSALCSNLSMSVQGLHRVEPRFGVRLMDGWRSSSALFPATFLCSRAFPKPVKRKTTFRRRLSSALNGARLVRFAHFACSRSRSLRIKSSHRSGRCSRVASADRHGIARLSIALWIASLGAPSSPFLPGSALPP